jgi:hypothetical protein
MYNPTIVPWLLDLCVDDQVREFCTNEILLLASVLNIIIIIIISFMQGFPLQA